MRKSREEYERHAQKRFWAKVDVRGPDECWEWQAGTFPEGYGWFKYRGKGVSSHRFAMGAVDPTPGREVCHSCGNRLCCNPAHLRLGTRSENQRDRVLHGTSNLGNTWTRGERCGQSKLAEDDVRSIRQQHSAGGVTLGDLAEKYGISRSQVSRILRRERWSWLD